MIEINTIVKKLEKISKKHISEQNKSVYSCILNDKIEMQEIVKDMQEYLSNINYLTENMKMFHMLGFLPRYGENMYICSCFLYWYIKSINPSIKIYVGQDGTIKGFVPARDKNNKNHIILQAHMDVVCLDFDSEAIHFGVYGKNPNVQFYHSGTDDGLWINKNNTNSVLGADDGKGIAEILNLLQYITDNIFNNINYPNISFMLTTVEEMPFGLSIKEVIKDEKGLKMLFPTWLKTKLYVNLDSYSGTEIDTYNTSSDKAKELQCSIIKEYSIFVEKILNKKSTQERAWNNPPSEVLFLKDAIVNFEHCKDLLFISMNAHSINPHSNKENMNMYNFDKFCKWFNKWICK